ncbi:MAG: M20 family metallopeptidase [Actinomycetota bacterium]
MLDELRACTPAMVDALARLVGIESPSNDPAGIAACAKELAVLGRELLGTEPDWLERGGRPHLRWSFGDETRIVLIGHFDTVWPTGTLERWPFAVDAGRASGPGVFDMKAGIVQGLFALSVLDDLDGVTFLVNSDEEIGSITSRNLIEDTAIGASAALVLEPSADGALKTGRKGVSIYEVEVEGRAAHAGLEPEKGANAVIEIAHQVLAMEAVARPVAGTTVTPTLLAAGTTANTVPANAILSVDVRALLTEEQARVDREMRALVPVVPGTAVHVRGGPNRPPMAEAMADDLYRLALDLADDLGIGSIGKVTVGGGSDGNFTAGVGVPTLDGLGAVGDHAHGEGEYVEVAAMPERAALVAALLLSKSVH